jgi:hypothetical protein
MRLTGDTKHTSIWFKLVCLHNNLHSYLKVYSNDDYLKNEDSNVECLYLKSLTIVNAYYDSLLKTFKTTVDNKFKSQIDNCKLIPILSQQQNENTQPIDMQLQSIPFYVDNLNNLICNIYVRFDDSSSFKNNSRNRNGSVQHEKKLFQNLVYFYSDSLASRVNEQVSP